MYRNYRWQKCNQCNSNNDSDKYEDICDNMNYCDCDYDMDDCECGFDEETNVFPSNYMYGQSYVPIQTMNKTFTPEIGLKMGTIFPELVSPYMPGQSMAEIEYLKRRNNIGEGCNNAQ